MANVSLGELIYFNLPVLLDSLLFYYLLFVKQKTYIFFKLNTFLYDSFESAIFSRP